MNTKTFIKRINCAYTKQGVINKRFASAINVIKSMAQGKQYYPYYWKRSKGYCNLQGEREAHAVELLCKVLGLEPIWDNNAPRGGMEGDYMYLNKNDIAKVKNVQFELIK